MPSTSSLRPAAERFASTAGRASLSSREREGSGTASSSPLAAGLRSVPADGGGNSLAEQMSESYDTIESSVEAADGDGQRRVRVITKQGMEQILNAPRQLLLLAVLIMLQSRLFDV